jgi:ligand-binding SRPBCC domain-containing protein
MGVYTIKTVQQLPITLEQAWDFLSSANNLKVITPDHMGFHILTENTNDKVYAGMIIQYTVSPVLNIPMRWVTEITHVQHLSYFVDEQRVGPYRIWHHEHHLKAIPGGVEMRDIVTYQPPMGFLGSIANFLFIKKQLKGIFEYRERKLIELFGKMP